MIILLRLILLFLFSSIIIASDLTREELDGLLKCYKHEIDAQQTGATKFNKAFSHFPKDMLYKLFIDKARLKNPQEKEKGQPPHLIFDVEEPGYFSAMNNAFSKLPEFIGSSITLDMILNLHDLAVEKVISMRGVGMAKGLLPGTWRYHIPQDKMKPEAINELYESKILAIPSRIMRDLAIKKPYRDDRNLKMIFLTGGTARRDMERIFLASLLGNEISSIAADKESLIQKIQPLVEHYYASLNMTTTMTDRLRAIGELLRALEVAHFLPDGNQRTYAFLLLTKLLIENGLPPAILEDPTMFDGYRTVDEMAEDLKLGIENFLHEDSDQQRNFLKDTCQDIDLTNDQLVQWLEPKRDYKPLFFYNRISDGLESIREQYSGDIFNAIKAGKVNEKKDDLLPLVRAVLLGSTGLIDELMDKGADPFVELALDKSPMSLAIRLGNFEIVEYMLGKMSKDNKDNLKKVETLKLVDAVYHTMNGSLFENLREPEESVPEEIFISIYNILDRLLEVVPKEKILTNPEYERLLKEWQESGGPDSLKAKRAEILRKHKEY